MYIDQASRFIWGRLLTTKDDATLHLGELADSMTSEHPDIRIRRLYTDGGGEYTSATFRAACDARGITQKFTNKESPEENHLAEKANEYVFNKIRVLLTMTGLPLWGYCFSYVVYVYSHTPQSLLLDKTPHECLHQRASRLYMLKAFGCLCYKFIPKSERPSKLSNPAVPEVFLGYAADHLSYLV